MKWSREEDYRGYRSYPEDSSHNGSVGARFLAAIKAALRSIAKPTPSPIKLGDLDRKGYSTLGTRSGVRPASDNPFPTAPANSNNARRH